MKDVVSKEWARCDEVPPPEKSPLTISYAAPDLRPECDWQVPVSVLCLLLGPWLLWGPSLSGIEVDRPSVHQVAAVASCLGVFLFIDALACFAGLAD